MSLIRHGRVIDGSGAAGRPADVGIENGRIVAVGDLRAAQAAREIDASGRIVAPGFIDSHSHSDMSILDSPHALSALYQGVTTEVIGNCGDSPAPWPGAVAGEPAGGMRRFPTFASFLDALKAARPAVNEVPLVGHGNLRACVPGLGEGPAQPDQVDAMVRVLRRALDEGARGLSGGLEYAPGSGASTSELQALVRAVGVAGVYTTHVRSRNGEKMRAAAGEALETTRGTGCPAHISHLGPRSPMPEGEFEQMLEQIEVANRSGEEAHFDVLMYDTAPHQLHDILPGRLQAGPASRVFREARTPEVMREIRTDPRSSLQYLFARGWADRVQLVRAAASPQWTGMTFDRICAETGKDPFEVSLDILEREGDGFERVFLATPYVAQDLIRALVKHPLAVPACDGAVVTRGSDSGDLASWTHSYGWAACYLEEYVLHSHLLSLEEGVRRLTSLPAAYFRLVGRGKIREGFAADVVVFDPKQVRDRSRAPGGPEYAAGFQTVIVNGRLAIDAGEPTGTRAGQAL